MDAMQKCNVTVKKKKKRKYTLAISTLSLCSFLLMMTAVICWSMKMRMVQRRAGITVMIQVHQGFGPTGLINQPRSSRVGYMSINTVTKMHLYTVGCQMNMVRYNFMKWSHLKLVGDLQFG